MLAALAAKWREPPRDALDTLVLGSANLEECDRYQQLDFTPFDPATKYTAGKLKAPDGSVFKVIKGAPQVIMKMCKCDLRLACLWWCQDVEHSCRSLLLYASRLLQALHDLQRMPAG